MPLRRLTAVSPLLLIAVGCASCREHAEPSTQPSVPGLSQRPVVGALGVPLGTVTEILARIVAGSETQMKQYQSSYLLRVTQVNGHPLARPPVMKFSVPGYVSVKLANDDFDLYELKTGTKTGQLDSAQIEDLQNGYVGKQVRLAVYETGEYSGIPHNLPEDVPVWQDRGFGFSTSLVVLAERP